MTAEYIQRCISDASAIHRAISKRDLVLYFVLVCFLLILFDSRFLFKKIFKTFNEKAVLKIQVQNLKLLEAIFELLKTLRLKVKNSKFGSKFVHFELEIRVWKKIIFGRKSQKVLYEFDFRNDFR